MLGNYEKLNGLTSLIAWSYEKWISFTKVYEQLGVEKANAVSVAATQLSSLRESPKIHKQSRF